MTSDRYDRQIRMFGLEGHKRIRDSTVAVVGIGGLGTHVVQQLALLGVGRIVLIDSDGLEDSNRNRYIGCWASDPVGASKVLLAKRLVNLIDPSIRVEALHRSFVSAEGFTLLRASHYVVGCLDSDAARLVLTEFCLAYSKPYIDLASDVVDDGTEYGGRIVAAVGNRGCPLCLEEIDTAAASLALRGSAGERDRQAIYGVGVDLLGTAGPSVVSVNGVVASLGVTELMVLITGLRQPKLRLTYRGSTGKVTETTARILVDCPLCGGIAGLGADADVERYLSPDSVRS